jgi:hypothetical protein
MDVSNYLQKYQAGFTYFVSYTVVSNYILRQKKINEYTSVSNRKLVTSKEIDMSIYDK